MACGRPHPFTKTPIVSLLRWFRGAAWSHPAWRLSKAGVAGGIAVLLALSTPTWAQNDLLVTMHVGLAALALVWAAILVRNWTPAARHA